MQTLRVAVVLLCVAVAMLAYALWGRSGRERRAALPAPAPVIPVSRLTEAKPVKEIDLEYHSPDLPPGPGQDIFATQCVICHSARYVLNQPTFPRKVWTAEVHKMVRVTEHPSIRNRRKRSSTIWLPGTVGRMCRFHHNPCLSKSILPCWTTATSDGGNLEPRTKSWKQ
jgi:hypothetical protein